MSSRSDVEATRPWMREGETFVRVVVTALSEDDLRAPSALPGWTRAHIVGHLARNAEALIRLATWARTGVEHPMYVSPERRNEDIEDSADFPVVALRTELVSLALDLEAALDTLDEKAWAATVRHVNGSDLPAAELPYLRAREVWLHAVDLGTGVGMDELPHDLVDALLDDTCTALTARDRCPTLVLAPTDRERVWVLGDPGPAPASVISSPGGSIPAASATWIDAPTFSAPASTLAGWLSGRVPASALPGSPPELPRWL